MIDTDEDDDDDDNDKPVPPLVFYAAEKALLKIAIFSPTACDENTLGHQSLSSLLLTLASHQHSHHYNCADHEAVGAVSRVGDKVGRRHIHLLRPQQELPSSAPLTPAHFDFEYTQNVVAKSLSEENKKISAK